MAINENKRLTPFILQADRDAYVSLSSFKGYQPANPFGSREHLAQILEEMRLARQAAWRFHNAMLDAKAQVIAQYGTSSDEVQALGLKKKSERRKPGRRGAKS